jgi:hypothetical protein
MLSTQAVTSRVRSRFRFRRKDDMAVAAIRETTPVCRRRS